MPATGAIIGMDAPELREGERSETFRDGGAAIPISFFNSAIPISNYLPALDIKLTRGMCLAIIGTEGEVEPLSSSGLRDDLFQSGNLLL